MVFSFRSRIIGIICLIIVLLSIFSGISSAAGPEPSGIPEGYIPQELAYDNGKITGYNNMDLGWTVTYSNPGPFVISGVNIYSARYDDIPHEIEIEIWDNNLETVYAESFGYDEYYPVSHSPLDKNKDFEWVTFPIPNLNIEGDFHVIVFTPDSGPFSWNPNGNNDEQRIFGGIAIGHSDNIYKRSNHSDRDPNRIIPYDELHPVYQHSEHDYMIRVIGAGPTLLPEALSSETFTGLSKPTEKTAPGFGFILGLLSIAAFLVLRRGMR